MKLSVKFREETRHQNPLLRAKIPVTILGFPFLTGIVAGDSSDLSFSLRSNFTSGPSLSLSYHPTLSPPSHYPFSLSLKSGIGLFGSPHDSPLTFTANFNPNSLAPTFSLFIKPQLGNFSLFKSVNSDDFSTNQLGGGPPNGELSTGSVSDFEVRDGSGLRGKPLVWGDLKKNSSILSGILVAARTSMPLTKRAMVNFRWGVSFPSAECGGGVSEVKPQFPVLLMNKISVERVDEVKRDKEDERKRVDEGKLGDFELLKGMCSWMGREVEDLKRENREMKQALEGMRGKVPVSRSRGDGREGDVVGKRMMPVPIIESSSEFDKWRSKKGGGIGNGNGGNEENGHRESKKSTSRMSEVENELQKAIKAASA